MNPIVVGVDGSASSLDATRWAAHRATAAGAPLLLVHGFLWPMMNVPLGPAPGAPAHAGLRQQAEQLLAEATTHAREEAADVPVSTDLPGATAAAALVAASEHADLVVLGSRGLGGFTGLLVGSTGVQVAAHARCPVVVVRRPPVPDGPVVVGVDGSPLSLQALAFAATEADLAGAPLHVIHVTGSPQQEPQVLDSAVAAVGAEHPGLAVHTQVTAGSPAAVLVDASQSARLVVVGSRGRGGFTGLLLGSTSHALLHHAHCPVAVVRPTP